MAQRLDVQYVNYYTAGSSALKIAPAIPLKTVELPKRKKIKRIIVRIDPVAVAGILMAAVMMVLMVVGVSQLISVRNAEVSMASYVDALQAENEELCAAYEAGYDPQDVEKTALALGMVPAEQVQQVTIQVEKPVAEESENFFTFLTGLFA